MMNKKTTESVARLHAVHSGKIMRLHTYDGLRKAEGYPTVETLRKYELVKETELTWGYSEGEEGIQCVNTYVGIIIK